MGLTATYNHWSWNQGFLTGYIIIVTEYIIIIALQSRVTLHLVKYINMIIPLI